MMHTVIALTAIVITALGMAVLGNLYVTLSTIERVIQ
jgi:hypothetical protein